MDIINSIVKGDALDLYGHIENNSIDLIVTDPPYDIGISGRANRGVLKGFKSFASKDLQNISKGIDIEQHFTEWKRILKKFHLFVFCSNKQLVEYLSIAKKNSYQYSVLIWHKRNAPPFTNNTWKSDIEYIVHIKESGVCFRGDSKLYSSNIEVSRYDHPTEKPVELVKKFISIGSKEGDIVFDPFVGSGTTVQACINLNRRYIGFEISDKFFKIAKEREAMSLGKTGLFAELFED